MNSYQKLKKENLQLKRQLRTLVTKPDSYEAAEIRFHVGFNIRVEELFMYGSRKKDA